MGAQALKFKAQRSVLSRQAGSTSRISSHHPLFQTPDMKLLKGLKHKKSSGPPPQTISSGNATDIAPRPSGFRAELDASGGHSRYRGLLPDRFDLTMMPDERVNISPRIAFQVRKDEGQEPPTPEAPTPSTVISVKADDRDEPAGKRSWSP